MSRGGKGEEGPSVADRLADEIADAIISSPWISLAGAPPRHACSKARIRAIHRNRTSAVSAVTEPPPAHCRLGAQLVDGSALGIGDDLTSRGCAVPFRQGDDPVQVGDTDADMPVPWADRRVVVPACGDVMEGDELKQGVAVPDGEFGKVAGRAGQTGYARDQFAHPPLKQHNACAGDRLVEGERAIQVGDRQRGLQHTRVVVSADFHAASLKQLIRRERIGNGLPDLRKLESMAVMRGGGSRCADRISRPLSGCDWHSELISSD